jgi:probable phosphoglycerate mutase
MIYLVRHGETVWNRLKRLQGRGDSPLTPEGVEHVRAVSRILRREIGDVESAQVESSPLERAKQTAFILCRELGIDQSRIRIVSLLSEYDCGAWEGLTGDEIDELHPGEREARETDKWNHVVPGGESYALVYERAKQWIGSVPDESVTIVVTHQMISRMIQGAYLGLSPTEMLQRPHAHDRVYRLHGGQIEELC